MVETIVYDTVVIAGDTVITTTVVKCDSLTNKPIPLQVSNNAGRLNQTIAIDDKGNLTANCHTDSMIRVITSKDKQISIYKSLIAKQQQHIEDVRERCTKHKWRWYSLATNVAVFSWFLRKPIFGLIKIIKPF